MSALKLWNDDVFSNDFFSDFFGYEEPRKMVQERRRSFSPACNVTEAKITIY